MSVSERPAPARLDRTWWREHSELGICALLAAAGALVLVDSLLLGTEAGSDSDPLGPHAVPTVLGVGLLVLAVLLAVDVLRGGHGEAEAGEDVELGTPPDLRAVGMLAGLVVAAALLVPLLGWPLTGAGLFWGAAHVLGARSFPRDPLVAAGLSLATWIVFDPLLGVDLPGGPLMGVF
jgi:putative tricarboxylic transport membrane protein